MNLIFIRHGDPDYKNDSLTEKGIREAQLLCDRVSRWKIDDVFVSTYGCAQATAKPFIERMGLEYTSCEWLHEFDYRIKDPATKRQRGAWDFLPQEFFNVEKYFDKDGWYKSRAMKSGDIGEHYAHVCAEFDKVLADYDYARIDEDKPIYNCFPHLTAEEAKVDTHLNADQRILDDRNIVFVCHLGVMFAIISYLTGMSPMQLWQGFFVAPTSVTVLSGQERVPGEVVFRVQTMGDVSHLKHNNESVSASGFFGNFTAF